MGPRASLDAVLFTKRLGPLSPLLSLLFNGYQVLFSWGGGGEGEVKRPESETDQSPPPSAQVENTWNYTFMPQYTFTACTVTRLLLLSFMNESVRTLHALHVITYIRRIYTCGKQRPSAVH